MYMLFGSTPPNRLALYACPLVEKRADTKCSPTGFPAHLLESAFGNLKHGGLLFFTVSWYIVPKIPCATIAPESRHAYGIR